MSVVLNQFRADARAGEEHDVFSCLNQIAKRVDVLFRGLHETSAGFSPSFQFHGVDSPFGFIGGPSVGSRAVDRGWPANSERRLAGILGEPDSPRADS